MYVLSIVRISRLGLQIRIGFFKGLESFLDFADRPSYDAEPGLLRSGPGLTTRALDPVRSTFSRKVSSVLGRTLRSIESRAPRIAPSISNRAVDRVKV